MINLENKNITFPEKMPSVFRKLDTIKEKGYEMVGSDVVRRGFDYIPQHGMQESFGTIEVDLLFTGGQPGGGKSFGLMGEARRNTHLQGNHALIVKKELVSTKSGGGSIVDYAKQIYLTDKNCEFTSSDNPTFSWNKWGSSIQFTHANFEGNSEKSIKDAQEKLKNKQASFIGIDELTDFPFSTFNYFFTRNRDSSGCKSKMVCTFNTNGWHFTRTMIDWYIGEDNYVIEERLGKIRYFILNGDTEHDFIWGDTKEEVLAKYGEVQLSDDIKEIGFDASGLVKSFTFIPCKMTDNRIMMNSTQGSHIANVFNAGASEQKKLFYGYWGETERGTHQLTNEDIMAQFEDVASDQKEEMYMTADIGDGGDPSLAIIWRGLTKIARHVSWTKEPEEKIEWLRGLTVQYKIAIENVAYDGTSIGSYIKGWLRNAVPIVSNNSPLKIYDEQGNVAEAVKYRYIIDQLMDKLVAMHKSRQIKSEIKPTELVRFGRKQEYIPYGDLCKQEKSLYIRYETEAGKVHYESKSTFKKQFKYSPDDADCEKYRMIFELDTKKRKEPIKTYSRMDFVRSMYGNPRQAANNFYNRR